MAPRQSKFWICACDHCAGTLILFAGRHWNTGKAIFFVCYEECNHEGEVGGIVPEPLARMGVITWLELRSVRPGKGSGNKQGRHGLNPCHACL